MRNFLNVSKEENRTLSDKFSFLLKFNADCTTEDFSSSAITIFDHWLYESNTFELIEKASTKQKSEWDEIIQNFLIKLVDLEEPYRYKYVGRKSKRKIQFSRYIGESELRDYVAGLFNETYAPNIVFYNLGVEIFFEDYWTIHFNYKTQEDCLPMLRLACECGLYILPAYSADHLNDYPKLSQFLKDNGCAKSLYNEQ